MLVLLPYIYVPDPTRGLPVFNGKIYIGEADTDPRIPSNQKSANLIQEDGTSVPAEYPILTNAGGVPTYNGSPVAIDVIGSYSLAIDDRNDQQVYYYPIAGEDVEFIATDLRSIMFDLGIGYDDMGTVLVTSSAGTSLDEAKWILDISTGFVYNIPADIPPSSTVVSLTGTTLVTNNGSFEVVKKKDDLRQFQTPLNNDWNGYLDPDHTESLPGGDTSAGTREFSLDEEVCFGIFSNSNSNDITFASDGWIFEFGIYKLYTFTAEQNLDPDEISVFIKGEDGSQYFVNNDNNGVNITAPSATQLKVEITSDIFSELGITKIWRFFVTERIGTVNEFSPSTLYSLISDEISAVRTREDVSASRTVGVTYTNDTISDIDMIIRVLVNPSNNPSVTIDGVNIPFAGNATPNIIVVPLSFKVKSGETYQVDSQGGVSDWNELRLP